MKKKALHEASRVVCEEIPPPLRVVSKAIPRDISAIAERALQKDRRHRYHTAGELAADLGRFLDGKPVKAQPKGMLDWLWRRGQLSKPISRRAGLVLIFGGILAVGLPRLVGSRLLDFEGYWPETAQIKASAAWTKSSLSVRAGNFYRLTATGSCKDSDGLVFGPEGTDPPDALSLLGPPADVQEKRKGPSYGQDIPRRLLIAQIRDSRILLPVGDDLTFVAPWTGPLSFRVNDETESPEAVSGDLRVTLARVSRPALVDKDGKTTISTRVGKTKYLLFEPEGIRWQFSSFRSALDEPDYPVLLNGIAWWPLPDKPDVQGWLALTNANLAPLLKTQAFAWAANPNGPRPKIASASKTSAATRVVAAGPAPDQPGLTFVGDGKGPHVTTCSLSQ